MRALAEGVEITHLLPEQCYSNPVSEKGSLVFYNFGWDILAILKAAEFGDAYMVSYYSHFLGYLGYGLQFLFVAEKKRKTGAFLKHITNKFMYKRLESF